MLGDGVDCWSSCYIQMNKLQAPDILKLRTKYQFILGNPESDFCKSTTPHDHLFFLHFRENKNNHGVTSSTPLFMMEHQGCFKINRRRSCNVSWRTVIDLVGHGSWTWPVMLQRWHYMAPGGIMVQWWCPMETKKDMTWRKFVSCSDSIIHTSYTYVFV